MIWTREKLDEIRSRAGSGQTRATIAQRMDISVTAVRAAARRYGIELPRTSREPWTDEQDMALKRMAKAGLTAAEAARKLKRKYVEGVRYRARKLGTPFRPHVTTKTKAAPVGKTRKCLCCRREFLSTWAGNRQCPRCWERNSRESDGSMVIR